METEKRNESKDKNYIYFQLPYVFTYLLHLIVFLSISLDCTTKASCLSCTGPFVALQFIHYLKQANLSLIPFLLSKLSSY